MIEKDFFELMNNGVYDNLTENLRKRVNARLIISAEGYKKYVRKPSFFSQKSFSENFVLIKFLVYDFHYNSIKRKVVV